jgi:hypothetical protein
MSHRDLQRQKRKVMNKLAVWSRGAVHQATYFSSLLCVVAKSWKRTAGPMMTTAPPMVTTMVMWVLLVDMCQQIKRMVVLIG